MLRFGIRPFATVGVLVASIAGAQKVPSPSIAHFLSPAFPSELVSAKKADRIAWIAYDQGKRNVYMAAAPDFRPVRGSRFLEDDGIVLSDLEISDDGTIVAFQRGGEPNRSGWIADPTSDPNGADRAIWAARSSGGEAIRLATGGAPALSPDGRWVAFAKDGQIFRVSTSHASTPAADRDAEPFIKEWGRQSNPVWSPDGSKLAFVSLRENHSFVGVYDVKTRTVSFVSPGVDFDTSPTWSADGKRIAFVRRPGTPFGQQAQGGVGGIGGPAGPAQAGGARGGRGGARGGGRGAAPTDSGPAKPDGLYRATFRGGYTISLMVATLGADTAREVWHNAPNDRVFPNVTAIRWEGDNLVFPAEPEEWIRYYSVSANGGTTSPIELTPGEGQMETFGFSSDGKTLYYASNVGDIDRRHLWRVPTAGGTAQQLTKGSEIEMYPAPLASGKGLAILTSAATRPLSVGLVRNDGTNEKAIFPVLTKDWPSGQVAPQPVVLKAEDGVEFHNQIFLPKDLKPGERRPAVVFVHGGPIRQMLLGYHYMDFYHTAYAVNEWLASQGYIVMSVNYRSGIGYGKSFRAAPNTGGRGNAEYRDVLAAGKYLQTRADVDPARIGIWGLSYGGVLTAQALARNSDIFASGVDMAGVHLWGSSLDSNDVSYQSSSISAIDSWKSPVLIWHNDDDRNVDFAQTIGLVDLLRARNVYYELIVNPDDTHETLLHRRWLYLFGRMQDFLQRTLWNRNASSASSSR
jgi:dipeptidyl aminopeptidase/acylaminoacyl peptidase